MMSARLKRGGLWWLILLVSLGLSSSGFAATQVNDIPVIGPESSQIWLDGALSVFRDHSNQLSFEEIRSAEQRGDFQPVTGLAVTSGFMADKPIWIHFAVRYPANNSPTWWLLLTPDILSKITIYAEQADGRFIIHHGGSALPFAQREMPGVGHGFKLGQDLGGLRHYFIRVTGILSARVEPSLWQEKPLIDYIGRYRGTLGLYVGILSVLILMAFGRALRYRRPLDIAYVSYLIGFELFNLGHNGFMQLSGLVDDPSTRMALIQLGLFLTGFSFLAVTRLLIVWPAAHSVWPSLLLKTGLGMTLAALLLAALAYPGVFLEVNFNQAIIWVTLSGLMGLWSAWRGYPNARLFAACFLPFVLWSATMSVMRLMETPLPDTFTRYRVLMITSSIHLVTLWFLILNKDARLERAKRQLEGQLSALRNEMSHINLFMSMLGHELNRPLNALAALAQGNPVSTGPVSEAPQRSHLSAIYHEFSEILKTCTDRMRQAVVTQLDRKPVDLAGLVRGVTEHFQLKTTTHLLRSDTEGLPTDFPCDPKLVSILLINLVENALRHSPAGGAVWVSGKQMNPGTVELSVTDEGPGIPASARERIFERYVQLNATAPQQEGMGLGLFIVKRIAELHGGHVVCESEPGAGSTFRVTLRSGA